MFSFTYSLVKNKNTIQIITNMYVILFYQNFVFQGQKPATGFGAPSFGAAVSSAAPAFGTFGNTNSGFGSFGQTNAMKQPSMTGFTGFGTQPGVNNLTGGLTLGNNLSGL